MGLVTTTCGGFLGCSGAACWQPVDRSSTAAGSSRLNPSSPRLRGRGSGFRSRWGFEVARANTNRFIITLLNARRPANADESAPERQPPSGSPPQQGLPLVPHRSNDDFQPLQGTVGQKALG